MTLKTELDLPIIPIIPTPAVSQIREPELEPQPEPEKQDIYAGTGGTSAPINPVAPAQQPAALRAAQVSALAKLGYPSKLSFNFFSDGLGYPIMRSLWHAEPYGPQPAGRTRGVITECVLPKYLVFRDYHPQLYAGATNTSIGGTHPVVLMDMAPDLLAFTKRVGVIPYTNENKRKDDLRDESIIEWKPDSVLDGFIVSKTPRDKAVEVYVDKPSRWLDTPQPRDYVEFISAPGVHIGWT